MPTGQIRERRGALSGAGCGFSQGGRSAAAAAAAGKIRTTAAASGKNNLRIRATMPGSGMRIS